MVPAPDPLAPPSGARVTPGSTVGGRFRIDGLMTRDAVSETYRAFDTGQGIPAAVRVIAARVKVANLGLGRTLPAMARRDGAAPGIDQVYLAPEVAAGGTPTLTADVYAL